MGMTSFVFPPVSAYQRAATLTANLFAEITELRGVDQVIETEPQGVIRGWDEGPIGSWSEASDGTITIEID
jgi:hypothetical protein